MKPSSLRAATLACAALFASCACHAQTRRITAVPQPARQAPAPGVAAFGLPNAAGLTPPGAPSLTPPGAANLSSPGVAPGSPAIDAGVATPVTPGGGGGVVVLQQTTAAGANAMGAAAAPRGPVSAVDIARAFLDADINHDGELSRAEAQRLGIPLPVSFDDLDRNHDGALSRFEYEDAFR
jgi:hypothetical protein